MEFRLGRRLDSPKAPSWPIKNLQRIEDRLLNNNPLTGADISSWLRATYTMMLFNNNLWGYPNRKLLLDATRGYPYDLDATIRYVEAEVVLIQGMRGDGPSVVGREFFNSIRTPDLNSRPAIVLDRQDVICKRVLNFLKEPETT